MGIKCFVRLQALHQAQIVIGVVAWIRRTACSDGSRGRHCRQYASLRCERKMTKQHQSQHEPAYGELGVAGEQAHRLDD